VFFGGGLATLPLLALSWSPRPLAAPIDVRIEFDAPSDCLQVSGFYDRVRARTDRIRLAEAGVPALTLRVRVRRKGAMVHGELRMTDEEGASTTREVDGASCSEVVEALSLTATLALDPTASPEAPPPSAPPPIEVVTLVATPDPAPVRSESWFAVEGGVAGSAAEVLSPHVSLGGALFVRVTSGERDRVNGSVGLALAHLSNDFLQAEDEVSVHLTTLTLTGCPVRLVSGGAFSLEPCVSLTGGVLAANSYGISNAGSAQRSWWSAGALLRAAVALGGGAALELEGGGAVPLLKRRFILSAPERVLGESPAISAFASLGAAYRF
jgi:hypothetical protein